MPNWLTQLNQQEKAYITHNLQSQLAKETHSNPSSHITC